MRLTVVEGSLQLLVAIVTYSSLMMKFFRATTIKCVRTVCEPAKVTTLQLNFCPFCFLLFSFILHFF